MCTPMHFHARVEARGQCYVPYLIMFNLLFLREDFSLTWLGWLDSKLQESARLLLLRAGLIGVFHLCPAVEAGDLPKGLRLTLQGLES